MKQFVVDFEDFLNENANKKERELYSDIKKTLETKIHRKVDLEAVFSVIDGILTYNNPEQLGLLALYFEKERKKETATGIQVETCKKLKTKFQNFIKEKCIIPETFDKIDSVYHDFFNRIAKELGAFIGNRNYYYNPNWIIFTTNYDVCLECFWRNKAHARLDTNFQHDDRLNRNVLRPNSILTPSSGIIKLFKLHGSINWQIDEETRDVIEVSKKGQSLMGTNYVGEMMVYPIAEKELYIEPYISMLVRLNRELREKQVWIVVGYSLMIL